MLDVGAKARLTPSYVRAERYVRLDIDPAKKPDICCDLHDLEWRGDPFDTVLAIEVLEHLYDPQRAIDRIHDALKPGGVCILSTRFMYRYHPDPQDHYRFTWDSLKYLFRNFRHVEVHPPRQPSSGDLGDHQRGWTEPRRPEPAQSARCAVQLEPHEVPARVRRVRTKVSRTGRRETSSRGLRPKQRKRSTPLARARQRADAGGARFPGSRRDGSVLQEQRRIRDQQASHTTAYFSRLLGVMDAVLTQPDVSRSRDWRRLRGGDAHISSPGIRAREPWQWSCHPSSIRAATHGGSPSLRAVAGNALQLPFRDRSLDAVVAFEVIEHLPDVAAALEEMLRVRAAPRIHHHRAAESRIAVDAARRSPAPARSAGVRRRTRPRRVAVVEEKCRGSHGESDSLGATEFLYREPILHATAGGDADAVYYAAPIDLDAVVSPNAAPCWSRAAPAAARLGWHGFSRSSCRAPRSWRGA